MILINYNRPLKPDQINQVEAIIHEGIERVIDLGVPELDVDAPVQPQLKALTKRLERLDLDLQKEPVIILLPPQNYQAVMVMADLHGRMGYFPRVIRTLLRTGGGLFPRHDAVEVLDPQALEDLSAPSRDV